MYIHQKQDLDKVKFLKKISNSKGFSLMEIMVAAGLIGIATVAYINFAKLSGQAVKGVSDSYVINRAILEIQNSILKDSIYYPPLSLATYNDKDNVSIKSFFEDSANQQKFAYRCFNKGGVEISEPEVASELGTTTTTTTTSSSYTGTSTGISSTLEFHVLVEKCPVNVWFFKTAVRDQTYSNSSELGNLPMSRLNFKVVYKDSQKKIITLYFSRLKTDAVAY